MTMTPKQWRQLNDQVHRLWLVFKDPPYNLDTGGNGICANSGDAPASVAAIPLAARAAAHATANSSKGAVRSVVGKLHKMGRSSGVPYSDSGSAL